MSNAISVQQLDGFFKKNYADKLLNLVPEINKLVKAVPFSQRNRIGEDYSQPVIVSMEQGVTYAGPGSGAFALEIPASMATRNALVKGFQMVIRGQMDYEVAALASSDETSFGRATATQVKNMLASITKRLEISMFYGRDGIGAVATGAGNITAPTTTTRVITLTNGSFAPNIWAGLRNAIIVARSNNVLVSSGADARFRVVSLNFATRQVTLEGTTAGCTALSTAVAANGCDFFFVTSWDGTNFNEMLGLKAILETSGTLFGINNTQFDLFSGNVYDNANARLTFLNINEALEMAVSIGGLDEDVKCYVSPQTWMRLNTDLAANKVNDYSYSNTILENGTQAIAYYSVNGKIEIEAHPCVKRSDAFLVPIKRMRRIGATDVTFANPGKGGEIFRELDGNAGFEMRAYLNQALFVDEPRKFVYIRNINNLAV